MSSASGNICIEVSRFHANSFGIFDGSIFFTASWLDKRTDAATPGAFIVSNTISTDSSLDDAIRPINSGFSPYAVSSVLTTILLVFMVSIVNVFVVYGWPEQAEEERK